MSRVELPCVIICVIDSEATDDDTRSARKRPPRVHREHREATTDCREGTEKRMGRILVRNGWFLVECDRFL